MTERKPSRSSSSTSSQSNSNPKPAAAPGPAPLSEFQNLGNDILFFDPPTPSQSTEKDDHHPQLIILCTWLGGATPRRIAKYTSGYRRMFPRTPVLVVQTVIKDFTVRSEGQIRGRLEAARGVVREVLARRQHGEGAVDSATGPGRETGLATGRGNEMGIGTGTEMGAVTEMGNGNGNGNEYGTGILLHIFSNGGCHIANQLAHSYLSSFHQTLPVRLQILDSSPGTFSISQTYGAAAHSVPKHHPWVLQSIERWGLWGAVVVIAGLQGALPRAIGEEVVRKKVLGGVGVDFEGMRMDLLDQRLWGGDAKETGRLYLYSKKDEAVSWRDVERHIRQASKLVKEAARKRGLATREEVEAEVEGLVKAERFENASHCGLVMEDEERYWRAVRESWEGMMERRASGQRLGEKGRPGKQSESGKKIVLGGVDDGEGEGSTASVVKDGDEARDAEELRSKRTSKL